MALAPPLSRPHSQPAGETPAVRGDVSAPTGAWAWLDDRLGLSALRYSVPTHANTFWYTLGGITFVGIFVLALTGVWLAQYYNPDPTAARLSVLYIQNLAPFGDVIRGIHVWTAYLVVLTASLHLIRVFVTASSRCRASSTGLSG